MSGCLIITHCTSNRQAIYCTTPSAYRFCHCESRFSCPYTTAAVTEERWFFFCVETGQRAVILEARHLNACRRRTCREANENEPASFSLGSDRLDGSEAIHQRLVDQVTVGGATTTVIHRKHSLRMSRPPETPRGGASGAKNINTVDRLKTCMLLKYSLRQSSSAGHINARSKGSVYNVRRKKNNTL